ncbi:MAG: glycosyltransferase [Azoarcus sp.]|nr:glycosyltransferase [Azoarcus sp.]
MSIQFSVAVPAYNSALFLAETLDSILGQSHPPAEVVVVDDGSTDETPDVLARYADRLTVVRIANAGPGIARKTAVEHCSGEWVALCDSDDIWHVDYLARKQELIDAFPETNLAFSNFSSFGPGATDGHTNLDEAPTDWLESFSDLTDGVRHSLHDAYRALLYFNVAYPSGTAFCRTLYSRAGGILPRYSRWLAEDAEFMRRMALHPEAHAAYDTKLCWSYRRHSSNFSTSSEHRNIIAGVRIIEEHLGDGIIPASLRDEVASRLVQRRLTAFMRAYWGGFDAEALEIARQIPADRKSAGLRVRELHCRFRALLSGDKGQGAAHGRNFQ